ncbi:ATP-binding protein [Nocardia crassostreae]|uniref:ATP-binding protein n=1 Tax=Nocardia crassostreae TaxID=53428 RepID=UPI00083460C5|nr:AAA family ATPase [Nocardia crassostreae]
MRLIGREHAESVLREELRRTVSSHGGLMLVTGEGGIGKTALITHAVGEFEPDAVVLAATAWSGDGVPGYWPWVQLLRRLRDACAPEEWAQITEAAGAALAILTDDPAPSGATARPQLVAVQQNTVLFRIGDAVTAALTAAARQRPVIAVIDDLHRADPESVKLLTFVARHSWFERIAVVAAVRDTEIDAETHPLRTVFAELWAAARIVELGGLSIDEIGELAAQVTGGPLPAEAVSRISALTGGNPFLAEQTARLWQGGSAIDTLTPGVRQTLEARLAPLPERVLDALTTAAFVGREFGIAVVAAAAEAPPTELADAFATALRARLVNSRGDERFVFVHDLIRETLLARETPASARARHTRVLAALEALPREVSHATAGDFAQHAYQSARAGDPVADERALHYLLAASLDACGCMAAGEVATHLRRALTLIPADHIDQRGRIGLDLSAAAHDAGDLSEARRAYRDVLRLARHHSEPELFARAALGLHDLGMPDPERRAKQEIELIDEAHRLLTRQRPPHRPPGRAPTGRGQPSARPHWQIPPAHATDPASKLAPVHEPDADHGSGADSRHDAYCGIGAHSGNDAHSGIDADSGRDPNSRIDPGRGFRADPRLCADGGEHERSSTSTGSCFGRRSGAGAEPGGAPRCAVAARYRRAAARAGRGDSRRRRAVRRR